MQMQGIKEEDLEEDPVIHCTRCDDSGEVPTLDYESYLGDLTKPCPKCLGRFAE